MKRIPRLGTLVLSLVLGATLGLGAAPAVAASGNLAGVWTSIDNDGSHQTLTITGTGNHAYSMMLVDEEAGLCDGDPAMALGSARIDGDDLYMRAVAVCVPGGNRLRGVISIEFTYDAGDDTLTDSFGVVWSRD